MRAGVNYTLEILGRTGIQIRSTYQLSASDVTTTRLISTSDAGRRDRTGTKAHGEGGPVPSWENNWTEETI